MAIVTKISSMNIRWLVYVFSLTCTSLAADPTYLGHFCSGSGGNTVFVGLKNKLVSSFPNATFHYGFYSTAVGQNPNIVRGLFLCRGDVTPENCSKCIDVVASDVLERCPYDTGAVIWHDDCMLHYSNDSILSSMDVEPSQYITSPWVDVEPDLFNQLRENLTKDLATLASSKASSSGVKNFAIKEANYTPFRLYGLAQCTPDIPGDECYSCLLSARSALKIRCRTCSALALMPSCTLQYNITPFYQQTNTIAQAPPTKLAATTNKESNASRTIIIVTFSVVAFVVLLISSCSFFVLKVRKSKLKVESSEANKPVDQVITSSGECIQYDFSIIRAATDDFSDANKLGEGGFGAVYKGKLANGELIAVKRLATNSGQGSIEFKNEVQFMANLQHRNLVRLRGFCLERNERLLIYEFVLNASLDYFLFDPVKRAYLDWRRRYKIIGGIARGLLYLHEDSRLRIIHRDLKASNVLLDAEMNPKISDFGMARLCPLDQTQIATSRIVGTYGYMAPEYALHGQFSAKSDVFSFGVLILEILSGRKCNAFNSEENVEHLLSYVWRNWKDGTVLNLVDPQVRDGSRTELNRCIHIGLLCVQENLAQRPNMASVVLMLTSYSVTLPIPSQPAFLMDSYTQSNMVWLESSISAKTESNQSKTEFGVAVSENDVTITEQYPR